MAGLTRQLAEFVACLEYARIPAEALDTVKRGFVDCVGVMFAGRDEPVVGVLRSALAFPESRDSTILFDRGRTSSPEAALINATADHALDYDDVAIDGHPSVVLVPSDSMREKTMSNLQEIQARKGQIIALATEGDTEVANKADEVIYIPQTIDPLSPLLV